MAEKAHADEVGEEADKMTPGMRAKPRWVMPVVVSTILLVIGCVGYCARVSSDRDDALAAKSELEKEKTSLSGELETCEKDVGGQLKTCRENLETEKATAESCESRATVLGTELIAAKSVLTDLKAQKKEAKARMAEFEAITAKFRKMIDTGKLEVVYRRGEMVVQLPAAILFPSGRAELTDGGKAALKQVAAILRELPKRRFTIAGHTDSWMVQGKAFKSNWWLSTARAVTVTEVLIDLGVKPQNLVAAGYAEQAPVATNTTKPGRQKNRRIEIILEPHLKKLALPKKRRRKK